MVALPLGNLRATALAVATVAGITGCRSGQATPSVNAPTGAAAATNVPALPAQAPDLRALVGHALPGLPGCNFEQNPGDVSKSLRFSCPGLQNAGEIDIGGGSDPGPRCHETGGGSNECYVGNDKLSAIANGATQLAARARLISLVKAASQLSPAPAVDTRPASVTGTATDSQGDAVSVEVLFGHHDSAESWAGAGSGTAKPAINSCDQDLASAGSSLARSVAFPVAVTMKVTSSLATDVEVRLSAVSEAMSGGLVGSPERVQLWGAVYADNGPICHPSTDPLSAGTVRWTSATATPGTELNWQGWLIIPNDITPKDPSGKNGVASRLLVNPDIRLGGNQADYKYDLSASTSVVTCSASDPAAGQQQYAAVDARAAAAQGCTVATH